MSQMETNISGNSWSEIRSQVDPKNQKQGANGRSEVTTQSPFDVQMVCNENFENFNYFS